MIQFVKKRDGRTIAFNSDRITRAIFLAASKVAEKENSSADYSVSEKITQDVISLLNSKYDKLNSGSRGYTRCSSKSPYREGSCKNK